MEQWYRAHAPVVRAYLVGCCRDPHDAEDLVQDTFVRALRSALPTTVRVAMPDRHDSPEHPTDDALRRALGPDDVDLEVRHHLEACEVCLERAETLAPPVTVPVNETATTDDDPRWLRRSVRRTLLAVAGRAAMLLVVGWIVVSFLSTLVWFPFVVERGDRVEAAVTATHDLGLMTIPGAEVDSMSSQQELVRRGTEVELHRRVGAGSQRLGEIATEVGALGFTRSFDRPRPDVSSVATEIGAGTDTSETLMRLGDGTAVTVLVQSPSSIEPDDITAVVGDEVALLWVGFTRHDALPLGYSACARLPEVPESQGWGTSGAFRVPPGEGGIGHAEAQFRRAYTQQRSGLGLPDVALEAPGLEAAVASDEPLPIGGFVVTGATTAVADALDQLPAEVGVMLLDVGFDIGPPEPCG